MKEDDSTNAEKTQESNVLCLSKMKTDEEEIEKSLSDEEEHDPEEDEETENKWDGSESEFVEDDDATEYEDKYSGIKFSYALTPEEIFSCIKHCGIDKNTKRWSNAVLSLVAVCVLAFYVETRKTEFLVGFILSVALLSFWVFGGFHLIFKKMRYKRMSADKKLSVEIYPDSITIKNNLKEAVVNLDGSCVFEEYKDMFLIHLSKQRIFIIPIRAIEPEFLPDVQAMLVAGTTPISESFLKNRREK